MIQTIVYDCNSNEIWRGNTNLQYKSQDLIRVNGKELGINHVFNYLIIDSNGNSREIQNIFTNSDIGASSASGWFN